MIPLGRNNRYWIGVILIVVLSTGTLIYNLKGSIEPEDIGVYLFNPQYSDSGVASLNETLTETDSKDEKIYDLLNSAFNMGTSPNDGNGEFSLGTLPEGENGVFSMTTPTYDDNGSPMINFTYSESGITRCVNAIHTNAQNYVDIGTGPCVKRLPQCLIVGNFKCGTRELIDFMSMHPRIKIRSKPYYELEFFDKKYSAGLQWYRQRMPCSFSNQVTIEKTPSYFQSRRAPERIYGMNSNVRIIVLVREPVTRTLSQFTFFKSRFSNYSNMSLKDALFKDNLSEINEKSHFVKFSIYDEAMERYLRYFKREQIKIIHSDDFKKDPYAVLHDLEIFLDLEHTIRRSNFVFNSEKGFQCLRESIKSREAACYGDKRGRNQTEVQNAVTDKEEVSAKLKQFFKPHNDRFFKLIGRSFDW